MIYPNFKEEKKLWEKGYKCVVGLDEVGVGPLAGPIVAAAVASRLPMSGNLPDIGSRGDFSGLRDSKQLSAKQRDNFYNILTTHPDVLWGIGSVSEKIIDKINIFQADKLAMIKAVRSLKKKSLSRVWCGRTKRHIADFLILDGNFKINYPIPQKSIIKADEKVFSCAAASIIAKVTRDRLMGKYHKKYPQYGFDKHMGYPTKLHYAMLKLHGPCKIHRQSYKLANFNSFDKI